MNKQIIVTPYDDKWPQIFDVESNKLKTILGENCLAIHHVGSTSVPGLAAKPVIDILAVTKEPEKSITPLESLGFKYKGEYNIPMRLYFNRSEGVDTNLHVYEQGHAEIELNLVFRNYLRAHPEIREEYAHLKERLLRDKSSFEKKNSIFTGYNLGKDAFIRHVLKKSGFDRIRLMKCTHYNEWASVKRIRELYFLGHGARKDPYRELLQNPDHTHLVFYQGVEIIGYAHVQFLQNQKAYLHIFALEAPYRGRGFGTQFLILCERWLKWQNYQFLQTVVKEEYKIFYLKNGYFEEMGHYPNWPFTNLQSRALVKKII